MNVSSQKYKFDSKLERPLITHLESKLMVSSNCQSSPKLRIVAVPLQHRLGANEDECIWWLHWHYCSRRAEFRGNNPKLRGKKYLNEQGVKDTVTTMKGKTLLQRYKWVGKRCMIEMNNFYYIGSTVSEEISTRVTDHCYSLRRPTVKTR